MEWLNPREGQFILETGSGGGILTREIARVGAEVVALDYEPRAHQAAISFLREEGADLEKIMHLTGDLYHLSFPGNCFDAINFSEVIEHLERPVQALRELYRTLKPGRQMFVSTWPNLANLVWRYRYARGSGTPEDFNPHTPWRVKQELLAAGFRILKFRLTNFYFTLPKIPWEINAISQDHIIVRWLEQSLAIPHWGSLMAASINALVEKPA